jgi:hypothetical protein
LLVSDLHDFDDDDLVEDLAQNPSKKRETDPESGNGSQSGEGGEGAS